MIPEIEKPGNNTIMIIIWILAAMVALFLFYKAGGFGQLKKMWIDTTVNKATNDFSQKRLMMWGAYWLGLLICFTQAFTIKIHPIREFNSKDAPMWVVIILFAFALGVTGAVLLGHLNARKTADAQGKPLTAPYVEPVKPVGDTPELITVEDKPDKG